MSQLDNIPPIRLPRPRPLPLENESKGINDTFEITTPTVPPRSSSTPPGGSQDQNDQREDHPFAISAKVTELGLSGEATKVRVKVLGGTYATGNGATAFPVVGGDYPAVVLDEEQTRTSYKGVVALFVPMEICEASDPAAVRLSDGRWAKAREGGVVVTTKILPAVFPVPLSTAAFGLGCAVHIGTWTSRYAEQDSGGTPTRQNRVNVEQLVLENVVLERGADAQSASTPWLPSVRISGGTVYVTPGPGVVYRGPRDVAPLTPTGVGAEVARGGGLFYLTFTGNVTAGVLTVASVSIDQGAALPTAAGTAAAPLSYAPLFSVDAAGVVTPLRTTNVEVQARLGFTAGAWLRYVALAR